MISKFMITVCLCGYLASSAFGEIVAEFQVSGTDVTWTQTGVNTGIYTVASSSEDYSNEIWERPVKDGTLVGVGTATWTTTDLYFGYGDLSSAQWGVGTSDSKDYLFMQWEVVGGFESKSGDVEKAVGLKGHYYFYFKPNGSNGAAIEINDATGLSSSFSSGEVKRLLDDNGDVTGTGLTVTRDDSLSEENSDGFENSLVKGQARQFGNFVEAAVLLSDLGLTKSDITDNPLDYAYAGVAVSNPSSPISDLFANDEFSQAFGSGVEYDTLRLGTAVPEPTSLLCFSTVMGCALFMRRRKRI